MLHWWEVEQHLEPRKLESTGLEGLARELIDDDVEFLKELWQDWND